MQSVPGVLMWVKKLLHLRTRVRTRNGVTRIDVQPARTVLGTATRTWIVEAATDLARERRCEYQPRRGACGQQRQQIAEGFKRWEAYLIAGFAAMRVTAVLTALQGGLLLAQTIRSTRPLELALDWRFSIF
jgi:hypothetical protein